MTGLLASKLSNWIFLSHTHSLQMEKIILNLPQLLKKFSAMYGTRSSITVLTRPRQLFLPWARPIHFILPSCNLKISFNDVLSPILMSSKWSLTLRFPHQNSACTSLPPHLRNSSELRCLHGRRYDDVTTHTIRFTLSYLCALPKGWLLKFRISWIRRIGVIPK
jgi:hypothetical protein